MSANLKYWPHGALDILFFKCGNDSVWTKSDVYCLVGSLLARHQIWNVPPYTLGPSSAILYRPCHPQEWEFDPEQAKNESSIWNHNPKQNRVLKYHFYKRFRKLLQIQGELELAGVFS